MNGASRDTQPPQSENSRRQGKNSESESPAGIAKEVGREVSKGLLQEAGTTLKWGFGGALIGAMALGGIGVWKFGLTGLWIGALVGAVLGGLGGVVVYIQGSSLTL